MKKITIPRSMQYIINLAQVWQLLEENGFDFSRPIEVHRDWNENMIYEQNGEKE